jgi:ribosomal protein L16/L10AE
VGGRGEARSRDVRARGRQPREIAQKAMALASAKMPVKTKFVVREEAHTDAS